MTNSINLKTGFLFPWPFQFLALIGLIASIPVMTVNLPLGVVMLIGCLFVLTTYSGIEINKDEKFYKEYFGFLFFKSGEKIKFNSPERIYINTSKSQERYYTAGSSSIYTYTQFNAFLQFDDGSKLHLLTNRKKSKLLHALNKISSGLNLRIEDNTGME